MKRVQVTIAVVGSLVFAVFIASGGDIPSQTDFLADAGRFPPTRNATCSVRLDDAYAADAGLRVYQRLQFPVVYSVLSDGGIDIQMPPMLLGGTRQSIDVLNWNDCTLTTSTGPVSARWSNSRPFIEVPDALKPWCRQGPGQACLLVGGSSYGNRNVSLCTTRANPAQCERVSGGTIYLGDSPEDL